MDVLSRIDEARRRCNVLEHPFYQRWSAGQLSGEELAFYAREYRHAVVGLAAASESVAAKVDREHVAGLERHAAEEAAHIALWDQFVADMTHAAAISVDADAAIGGDAPANVNAQAPLDETLQCVAAWTAGEHALEHLAVLYAIEASQPAIAQTKLDGLVERYGYTPDSPATEYFRLHATLDIEHAREAGWLIERLMSADRPGSEALAERMVARAEAALGGNWRLLDGVDRHFGHAA